ncbi:glycosyltransferase family 2 protein [Neisseria perflava]|uniref:glycosyltransferase family 2 protein n=1 Tax=Neisseria perflava TaxID=33053 RepID=UPI00209C8417|nr:glycosyltransferase family 2 protein [Neisseria perflava]MCP1660524.1 hypothetical protein [Neisseria perflava]
MKNLNKCLFPFNKSTQENNTVCYPSWSVVVTVKSTPTYINYFIQHHLALGAKEIFVFLDSPNDFPLSEINQDRRVHLIGCDDDFWKNCPHFDCLRYQAGTRPELVEYRQYHNMLHAQLLTSADWLLMLDIDELLYSRGNVNEILATYPDNVFSVLARPREAVYLNEAPQSGLDVYKTPYFKLHKYHSKAYQTIYNRPEMINKGGFYGYVSGKSFTRVNKIVMQNSCHLNASLDRELVEGAVEYNFNVLHFESQTPRDFIQKTINRANKTFNVGLLDKLHVARTQYLAQIYNEAKANFSEEKGREVLNEAYHYMHVLSDEKMQLLDDENLRGCTR